MAITLTLTTMNGTQASPSASNDDTTPTLSGVYTSSGGLAMASSQHLVYDETGNTVYDSTKTANVAASGATVSVTVPGTYLKYGKKYQWKWKAWDSTDTASDLSSAGWFECVLTDTAAATDLAAGKHLYAMTSTGQIIALEEGTDNLGSPLSWDATCAVPMESAADNLMTTLHLKRVWLKVYLPEASTMSVRYSVRLEDLDDQFDWLTAHELNAAEEDQIAEIQAPFAYGEAYEGHEFRLKLSGTGPHRLYKLAFEYEEAEV